MGWREDRRLDKATEAEQARKDAVAAAEVDAIRARSAAEIERANRAARAEETRRDGRHRESTRAARRRVWRQTVAAVRGWVAAHVVDLLIYPLAGVSAVMAVPAMAGYGRQLYGAATGTALFWITELGMWSFAIAVQVSGHRSPDRPVWALQLGVWAFAGVAFAINALHGVDQTGPTAGLVMGVVSVAGVLAHQLVSAAPRRPPGERDLARAARRARRTLARVRRAAVRHAVAEIDDTGTARLVFTPGRYRLTGTTHRRLTTTTPPRPDASSPGLDTPSPDGGDALDRELAALLADPHAFLNPPSDPDQGDSGLDSGAGPGRSDTEPTGGGGGGVGTLDRRPDDPVDEGGDQHESTPTRHQGPDRHRGRDRAMDRGRDRVRSARSIEDLRTELRAKVAADPSAVDLGSAESIRRALRCAPKFARQLRNEFRDH